MACPARIMPARNKKHKDNVLFIICGVEVAKIGENLFEDYQAIDNKWFSVQGYLWVKIKIILWRSVNI